MLVYILLFSKSVLSPQINVKGFKSYNAFKFFDYFRNSVVLNETISRHCRIYNN